VVEHLEGVADLEEAFLVVAFVEAFAEDVAVALAVAVAEEATVEVVVAAVAVEATVALVVAVKAVVAVDSDDKVAVVIALAASTVEYYFYLHSLSVASIPCPTILMWSLLLPIAELARVTCE
jgi:hypothetical protein